MNTKSQARKKMKRGESCGDNSHCSCNRWAGPRHVVPPRGGIKKQRWSWTITRPTQPIEGTLFRSPHLDFLALERGARVLAPPCLSNYSLPISYCVKAHHLALVPIFRTRRLLTLMTADSSGQLAFGASNIDIRRVRL